MMNEMSRKRESEEVRIKLLTLSGCRYCEWLMNDLDNSNITYVKIDAEEWSNFSDKIEAQYKTSSYPIVFISVGADEIVIVPETDLETSKTLRTFDTIPQLVGIIKSYIK